MDMEESESSSYETTDSVFTSSTSSFFEEENYEEIENNNEIENGNNNEIENGNNNEIININNDEKKNYNQIKKSNESSGIKLKKEGFFKIQEIKVDIYDDDNLYNVRDKMRKLNPPEIPIFLQWKNLSYEVTFPISSSDKLFDFRKTLVKKMILKNINGKIAPGQFLAIMGPTGCGKTTLITVLSTRVRRGVSGTILVNGKPPNRNFKRRIAFVLQDDILHENLTVQETLTYTARLRLPNTLTKQQKLQKVNEIIDILNLSKAKNTVIGGPFKKGVSGGERKRVSIGNQLLTNPSLIFLDEPTSGLDTSTAINLIKILKGLSDAGITVITTIHQPSSQMYELFDQLMLLVDGQTIYYGKAANAVSYFASLGLKCSQFYNPADFMMGLILQQELKKTSSIKQQLVEAFQERIEDRTDFEISGPEEKKIFEETLKIVEEKTLPKYPISYFEQFSVLLNRCFFQAKGNYITKIPWIQIISVSLLVSFIWLRMPRTESRIEDRFGALFFVGLFAGGFFPLFNALYNFPSERAVLLRERMEGAYMLSAYFLAKIAADVPFQLLFPTIFISICYYIMGFVSRPQYFFLTLAIIYVLTFASSALGLTISALVKDVKLSVIFATIAMLTMTLTGGFYVEIPHIPVWIRWLEYLSFIKYAFDGLIIAQFDPISFKVQPGPDIYGNFSKEIPGDIVAKTRFLIFNEVGIDIVILSVYAVGLYIIAFLSLKYFYKPYI